jgi:glycolate oxidase iron-sulfur subunit
MDDIASTGAETVVTANVGCMLQLRAGVEQRQLGMEVLHVIELLDRMYQAEQSARPQSASAKKRSHSPT